MRPIWNGSISFGLINIPVRLYSGSETREGIDLDMLHKADHSPIRFARICRKDGEEVPWNDIVKGYEYRDGDYIVLTKKELENIDAKKTQTIDIQQFVDEPDIDIRYYEKPYYLEAVKGGEKAYALLRGALQKSDKLALAKFVLHEREHVAVIKPVGRALVLNQMRFPSDLREPGELHLPTDKDVTDKELEMALKLIKQETKPFIAEDLRDTYTEELEELIKDKTKGKKLARPRGKQAPKETSAHDLMSALKASLKE
ncbi:MAG TPA: Ku protein [Candidatus Saccharimonadales bacterium]|nr:Ku protein [Candidatus Saccharimonadales bacterium]